MKIGDKLKCLKTVDNLLGMPLFKKGEVYEVLYINNEDVKVMVCLNHTLYANEYNQFSLEWVNEKFKLMSV
jgi:hypothetical protein